MKKILLCTTMLTAVASFSALHAAQYHSVGNGSAPQITEHSNCRVVTNNSGSTIFVPTNTVEEWNAFIAAGGGSGVSVSACPPPPPPACFCEGMMVEMEDGSKVAIEDIELGDVVKEGGRVYGTGKLFTDEIYNYKGIKVSGSHAVLEDGTWIRVRDSKQAKFLTDEETVVYIHANEHNRIIIEGQTFLDFAEVGAELHQGYDESVIALLNGEISPEDL